VTVANGCGKEWAGVVMCDDGVPRGGFWEKNVMIENPLGVPQRLAGHPWARVMVAVEEFVPCDERLGVMMSEQTGRALLSSSLGTCKHRQQLQLVLAFLLGLSVPACVSEEEGLQFRMLE
jgi:hypothetical protein